MRVDIEGKLEAAETNPDAEVGAIPLLKGILKQLQNNGSGYVPATLATLIDGELGDNVKVSGMTKGGIRVAHNAIVATATSAEIDCRGFNTLSVECAVSAITSGNWLIELLGSYISGGTFGNCHTPKDDGTFVQQKTPTLNANGNTTYYFRGIPNYVKIKATRTTDGTLSCIVTPMNL